MNSQVRNKVKMPTQVKKQARAGHETSNYLLWDLISDKFVDSRVFQATAAIRWHITVTGFGLSNSRSLFRFRSNIFAVHGGS